MRRIEQMIERAYTLSAQVLNGDELDIALAEEVSGESAEFLAMMFGDWSAFESEEVMDMELLETVKKIKALELLDRATTIIYNMEGDAYQAAYEQLEKIIQQFKETMQ
jgi:hypothetical protein